MKNEKTLILIPSFEPDKVLPSLCESLANEGFTILIVNDGSDTKYDQYFVKAKEFATLISYKENKGKGYALRYGMKYIYDNFSNFSYFLTVDGDGQHALEDIVVMSKNIEINDRIIIGERDFKGPIPIKSKIGNVMSKVTQTLASKRFLSDNQCGLRAFHVSDIPWLIQSKENRYEYEMSVISKLIEKEIPFDTQLIQTIYVNDNAKTHFRPFLDTILIQKSILIFAIINILIFILEIGLTHVFNFSIFHNSPLYLELSIILSFSLSTLVMIGLKILFYRPRNFIRLIFRTIGYKVFLFAGILISIELFTRLAGLPIYASYLIGMIILLPGLFFLLEGFGLAYDLS